MIRKIAYRGSYSWSHRADKPWGLIESASWSDSRYRIGNWSLTRFYAKSWSSFCSWCWVWSATPSMSSPTSESWGEDS